jgi:hypothetical protein
MNYASEILKNIFDDNAKGVIDTVDQALAVKVNDQMDEMKKSLIDSVYENDFSYMLDKNEVADDATSQVDEAELKVISKEERAEMLKGIGKTRSGLKAKAKKGRKAAMDDDNLANNYGDKHKVTRGDIISQAIHNKKGKKK